MFVTQLANISENIMIVCVDFMFEMHKNEDLEMNKVFFNIDYWNF